MFVLSTFCSLVAGKGVVLVAFADPLGVLEALLVTEGGGGGGGALSVGAEAGEGSSALAFPVGEETARRYPEGRFGGILKPAVDVEEDFLAVAGVTALAEETVVFCVGWLLLLAMPRILREVELV